MDSYKMLLPVTVLHWSNILNVIIQTYLSNTTICILWNDEFDLELRYQNVNAQYSSIIIIEPVELKKHLTKDVYNHMKKRVELLNNGVHVVDELMAKLIASIEHSHCENDIPHFVEAFKRASLCSIWRSMRNKFIFVYAPALEPEWKEKYFQHRFFEDQPNILLIEGTKGLNSTIFNLKTNKYTGPRYEKPNQLLLLDIYDAIRNRFYLEANLFPDKTYDLKGREVVVSILEYRPDVVLTYNTSEPNSRDVAQSAEGIPLHIDGTEIRIILEFCKKHNCTLLVTTQPDWGEIYPNISGDGALGLVLDGRADLSMGAMYLWHSAYLYLDVSIYSGRSGITCVVPAPQRMTSWLLPLEPFQLVLWCAVMFCLVFEILSLLLLRRWQFLIFDNQLPGINKKTKWWHSFSYSCSTTFRLFISQSSNQRDTLSTALRVLLFACFMNDIVITSIYGGGLSSILTIPSFDEAPDSLQRLRKHGLHWAATSEAWVSSIRGTNDSLMNAILDNFHIYDEIQLRDLVKSADMGFTVERLLFGHYAVETHLSQEVLPNYKIMIDDIYFQYTVSFVQRLWPLLERYDELMNIWHASGLDKYWEWRSVADYLDPHVQKLVEASLYYTREDASRGPIKLGMPNFAGILLVWCLGIMLATIIFCSELLWKRCQN